MEIKVIDSLASFIDLREKYLQLIENNGNLTPFYTHKWLTAWWKAFENRYRFRVFCIYQDRSLILAIPLMFGEGTFLKCKIKKASFIGGDWGRVIDIPVHQDATNWDEFFLSWLFSKEAPDWELLTLGPFVSFSQNAQSLLRRLEEMRKSYKIGEKTGIYLPLSDTWEKFLSQKSRNFRRTIKRKQKKAMQGSFKYSRKLNPTSTELHETVFQVTRNSWQGREERAVASTIEGQNFYRLLAGNGEEFDMDLAVIHSDKQPVAYLLGLLQGQVYHALDTGFDPVYSDLSPGYLVQIFALKELFGNKLQEFNFGFHHEYKERFQPLSYDTVNIVVFRNRLFAGLSKLVDQAKICITGTKNKTKRFNKSKDPTSEE